MARLNKKLQESLMSEIIILRKINHPNIIRFIDMIEVYISLVVSGFLVFSYCSQFLARGFECDESRCLGLGFGVQ